MTEARVLPHAEQERVAWRMVRLFACKRSVGCHWTWRLSWRPPFWKETVTAVGPEADKGTFGIPSLAGAGLGLDTAGNLHHA